MSAYSLVLFLHVLAAVFIIGGAFFSFHTRAAIQMAPTLENLQLWLGFAARTLRLTPAFAMALLLTGIYMGHDGYYQQGWFKLAGALWLVNSLCATQVLKKSFKQLGIAAAQAGQGEIPAAVEALRRSARREIVWDVMTANDVAVLYLMMEKLPLRPALAVIAITNVLFVAVGLRWRAKLRGAQALPAGQPS